MVRLREAAAAHADAGLPHDVPAQPWPASEPAHGAQTALLARAGAGLAPYLVTDDGHFAVLAYQRMLGRVPDAQGRAWLLEQLRLRVPRADVLAQLALSPEARAHGSTRWGARAASRVLRRALRLPLPGAPRVARALWRRLEARLTRHAQRSAFGRAWQVAQAQDALAARLDTALARLDTGLARLHGAQDDLAAQLADTQRELVARLDAGLADLRGAQQEQHARLRQEQDGLGRQFAALQLAVARRQEDAPAEAQAVADFFAAFEARFRGPAEGLRAQLAQDYLGRLAALREALGPQAAGAPCLDLGCGRGVWLELLREHGFTARGVDLNARAAAEAQARGLDVQVAEVVQWLQAQPDGSALAITAFHLVEHLPFAARLAMVAQCARVLRPGGLLVLETPNPENIWVGTHTFYHDPSHSQPLTPDGLEFLVNYHGLETVEVARLHPYPDDARLPEADAVTARLNAMTCGGQDFAVIARKPLAAGAPGG